MKKGLVILMAVAMLFAMTSLALAKGNIEPNTYSTTSADRESSHTWTETVQGVDTTHTYTGYATSTHKYGTWNSPYTAGIDGYNYNDFQDYVETGTQAPAAGDHTIVLPMNPMMQNEILVMFMDMLGGDPGNLPPNVQLAQVLDGNGDPVPNPFYEAGDLDMNQVLWEIHTVAAGDFNSGPHGGYLTSTHRCRECHAVHRAAGKFKLLRSDTRFEACDWCHGTGAGSGFNIQMDNDDNYSTEYNVGHTMGFGISSGKWKAPDDTYPAFTPNYWQGGFSCFDCHSPHANPQRMLGYNESGDAIESIVDVMTGQVFNLGNPGHDLYTKGGDGYAYTDMANFKIAWVPALGGPLPNKAKPYYLAGSWLLIKNPDREIATGDYGEVPVDIWSVNSMMPNGTAPFGGSMSKDESVTVNAGMEIPDSVTMKLTEFSTTPYPVNKMPIDWNNPIGSASILEDTQMFGMAPQGVEPANPFPVEGFDADDYGYNIRNPFCKSLIVDEFCTDCHDGNSGLHTEPAPLFSEDRALRADDNNSEAPNWKGSYDIAYGHDTNVRH